jgi:hypothetical protein
MSFSPADSQVAALLRSCSNEGRWGEHDERGTLNFINSGTTLEAVRAVRTGEVVPLGRLLTPGGQDHPGSPVWLAVWSSSGHDALDTVTISPHGFEVTHLDAVGHSFFEGAAYNGRRAEQLVDPAGLHCCDISVMGGIVTRGVLLDVARARGAETASGIGPDDLERAELLAGTRVRSGDAIFVRSFARGAPSGPGPDGRRPGLLAAAIPWLHDREVALYSGDCIEQLPGTDPRVPMPLHQIGHVAMGLAILDNPDVDALRQACDRNRRAEFLLIAAPLPLSGATGSAVNPLAIF